MSTPPTLPVLPGLGWSRHKKPGFQTRIASHVSGREVRLALQVNPLYEFEAVLGGLSSATTPAEALAGLGASSLQSLMGFFLQMQGQFGTFLYADPDDGTVAGGAVAIGDGTTQSFIIPRVLGGFSEPSSWVTNVGNVYLNGVAQAPATWVFTPPNSIGFYTAPSSGTAITADFSFAFQCRFLDDQMDFEEFMAALWKLDSLKFRSIKANTVPAAPPQWFNLYQIGGTLPMLFADFTTEGGSNHYLYNGTTYAGAAAWLAGAGATFSRASAAYYTNSSGLLASAAAGVPRFDYDPVALTSRGILLEGAGTNLCPQSSTFTTSPWTTSGENATVTANTRAAPDGTTTASTLASTGTTDPGVYQAASISYVGGTATTMSVFVQAGTCHYPSLSVANITGSTFSAACVFDLTAPVPGTATQTHTQGTGSTIISTNIVGAPNGFYRISMTFSLPGSASLYPVIQMAAAATGSTFDVGGDVTNAISGSTLIIWGCQIESLAFSSSYIPTTASSASRAADAISAVTWSAITAGTLYAKSDTEYTGQAQRIIQIDDNTANNRATLEFNGSAAGEFDFLSGGASEAMLAAGTITANAPAQLAAAFQANDFAFVVNGIAPAVASSGAVPAFSRLRIGQDTASGNNLFGHLAQIGVWNDLRGSNANLQSLT